MVSDALIGLSLAGVTVLAVTVLGTVKRRERLLFVPGVLAVILGLTFLRDTAAGAVALVGLAAVLLSTVPMLRSSTA